jgi:uncharacterized repeat protein (TIGR02543 family)
MKKIAVLAIIALVFAACFNDWQGDEGSFSVGVGSSNGAVAIINGIPIANFRHVITLSDGPGLEQSRSIDGAGSVKFSVIPGKWTVTIKAYVTDRGNGGGYINGDEPLASGSVRVEIKPGPNDVITVPMDWRKFTVTFDSNGGSEVPDQRLHDGQKVKRPEGVTKDGHSFNGWYTDNDTFEHSWDFDDIVTQHITLYAKWIKNPLGTFTVTFVSNGGSVVYDQVVTDGEKAVQPQGVTRAGHTLEGWYRINYSFEQKWDFNVDVVKGNIMLFANWTINPSGTFTVAFVNDDGTFIPDQIVREGDYAIQPQGITRDGYTLEGWYTEKTFEYKWNFDDYPITYDIVLFAQWIKNPPGTFTVTFVSNGGTAVPDQTVSEGAKIIQPQDVSKDGYILEGWYRDNNTFEDKWDFANYTVTNNLILYAKWITVSASVPVTNITEITLTMTVGTPLTLTGTVVPANATNKTIAWSIKNAGTTGATLNGNTLNATTAGTVTVTATIADGIATGTPFTKDFVITVQKAEIFTFDQITDAAPIILDQVISRSGSNWPKTVELKVDNPGQYSSIDWYITGTNVRGSGSSFILDSANIAYGSVGEYFLTLEVWKDGIPYSKTIIFEVVE